MYTSITVNISQMNNNIIAELYTESEYSNVIWQNSDCYVTATVQLLIKLTIRYALAKPHGGEFNP